MNVAADVLPALGLKVQEKQLVAMFQESHLKESWMKASEKCEKQNQNNNNDDE